MKSDSNGAMKFTIGTSYMMHVTQSQEDLIKRFMNEPDKGAKRVFENKEVNYFFKIHQYEEGFVLLYQNNTKNLIASENIDFENTNLQVVNPD